jgi:hypothetical protein
MAQKRKLIFEAHDGGNLSLEKRFDEAALLYEEAATFICL